MKNLIFSLLASIIFIQAYAQDLETLRKLPPQWEVDFASSAGITHGLNFKPITGNDILFPIRGHILNFESMFNYRIEEKIKLGLGLGFGMNSMVIGFKIKKEDFPKIGDLEDIWPYAIFSDNYENVFLNGKIGVQYAPFNNKSLKNLWFSLNAIPTFYLPVSYSASHHFQVDTSNFNVLEYSYEANPAIEIKMQYSVGAEYRWKIKTYDELILGLNYRFSLNPVYSGNYTIFDEIPEYRGTGTFDNYINSLSLKVGLSFNNKGKTIRNMEYTTKTGQKRLAIPDSIPDNWELRFATNATNIMWPKITNVSGLNKIYEDETRFGSFYIDAQVIRYIKPNIYAFSGLEYFSYYTSFFGNIEQYRQQNPNINVSNNLFSEFVNFVNIPIGLGKSFNINHDNHIEAGIFVDFAFTLGVNNGGGWTCIPSKPFTGTIDNNCDSAYFIANFNDKHPFSILVGGNIAFVHDFRNENKVAIGIKYKHDFSDISRIDYTYMTEDGGFQDGNVVLNQTNLAVYLAYSFTFKKRRYYKSMGI